MQFLLVNGRLFQLVANVIRYTETNVYVAIFQCHPFFHKKTKLLNLMLPVLTMLSILQKIYCLWCIFESWRKILDTLCPAEVFFAGCRDGFEPERIEAILHKIELHLKHQSDNFGLNLGVVSTLWMHSYWLSRTYKLVGFNS